MQQENEQGLARSAKRRADARLEAGLRALGLLDPDDDIAEAICGPRAVLIAYRENPAAEPQASALDRGCCGAFSSRRLYFPHAKLVIGLEWLWRVECWGKPDFDDILPGQRHQLAAAVAGFVAHELQMTPHAIWLLVIRSEQLTFEQGWNPPPPEN